MGWNIDRFLAKDTIVSEFICSICTDVVECPVQTPCQHLFCNECIRRWINAGNRTCPEDRQALTVNALKPPSRLTLQFLNKLIIRCKNYNDGCRLMSTFEDVMQLKEHETNQCQVDPNSLVREVCDTYEKEEMVMKEKINELLETITNKDKEIHKLERRIQKQMKEQDKMVKEKEKMSKVIVEFATSHAAIGKSIAEEASKYALYATIPSQPSNEAIVQQENGAVSSSNENQIGKNMSAYLEMNTNQSKFRYSNRIIALKGKLSPFFQISASFRTHQILYVLRLPFTATSTHRVFPKMY